MGKQPIEKVIDGETYTFYLLSPDVSLDVLEKLIKLFGPSIGAAFPTDKPVKIKDVLDMEINVGNAVTTLAQNFTARDTKAIIKILRENTLCKGRGKLSELPVYNELFTGNLGLLFKVLFASLEAQYGNFFGENKDLLEEKQIK